MHPYVLFKLMLLGFFLLVMVIVFRGDAILKRHLVLGTMLHVGGAFFGFFLLARLAQFLAQP